MASSAPIPAPRGLVVCSAHNAQRKGEFCEMKPVMNADMEVIDYVCVCKPAFRCKSAAERNGNVGHDEATGTTSPPPPVIMDASSTSVSAHRTHPHATSASAAAAGGAGEADIGTLFAVSFYDTSRPAAGASPSPQQGADASAAAAAAPKDGNPGSVAAATAAAAVAISDSDDAPESEADSLESVPHITPAVAAVPGPSAAPTAPRGRPRYYDAAQGQGGERGGGGGGAGAGGGHASPVKVCWSCGMPGHEKPSCPNILCRTCHQKRGPYGTPHRCGFVQTPSPFLVNPTAAEWRAATAGTDMSAVRCVACNGLGHLDCSVAVTPSSYALVALSASSDGIGEAAVPQTVVATCCFCGVRGHTVHDCRQRERVNPDNFERRQQVAASDTEHRGTSSGFGMGSYQGGHNNSYGYSSQQQQPPYQRYPQQQQQQQQRSYGGSSSAPYARYGNDRDRDRGGQRREREWDDNSNHNYRDRRDQRGGGYAETHSRYEGGERHEHQRRRFDSGPSSPAPTSSYSRDRYPSAGGGGGGRAPHQQWEQQGGASSASRSHDHSSHHPHHQHSRQDQHSSTGSSHQQQPRSNTGWKGRGGRRGNSGYDSGDDLF